MTKKPLFLVALASLTPNHCHLDDHIPLVPVLSVTIFAAQISDCPNGLPQQNGGDCPKGLPQQNDGAKKGILIREALNDGIDPRGMVFFLEPDVPCKAPQ